MGNGDALPEVGGALGLAGFESGQVARGDQAVALQQPGEHPQRGGLVRRRQAHGNLPCGQFEHCVTSHGPCALLVVVSCRQPALPTVEMVG
ncbi:hypothetical protein D3C81_1661420 [compost metagenome]